MQIIYIRKRWILLFLILLMALLITTLIYGSRRAMMTMNVPSTKKVIVIDPGHGGIDPGAVSRSGILEKDINLKIALYLREYLEQSGSIVILTRDKDMGLYSANSSNKKREDLKNRKNIVRETNPDIFITIHLNSFTQSQYNGAQTFYPLDNPSGKRAAVLIQEELINALDKSNTRVALSKDNVYIINELSIPTVLVECGFLSNAEEAKSLNDSKYQRKIAWAIYVGLQDFFTGAQ